MTKRLTEKTKYGSLESSSMAASFTTTQFKVVYQIRNTNIEIRLQPASDYSRVLILQPDLMKPAYVQETSTKSEYKNAK